MLEMAQGNGCPDRKVGREERGREIPGAGQERGWGSWVAEKSTGWRGARRCKSCEGRRSVERRWTCSSGRPDFAAAA